jgi:hypothetical protein
MVYVNAWGALLISVLYGGVIVAGLVIVGRRARLWKPLDDDQAPRNPLCP